MTARFSAQINHQMRPFLIIFSYLKSLIMLWKNCLSSKIYLFKEKGFMSISTGNDEDLEWIYYLKRNFTIKNIWLEQLQIFSYRTLPTILLYITPLGAIVPTWFSTHVISIYGALCERNCLNNVSLKVHIFWEKKTYKHF